MLKDKLALVPQKPGSYQMRDAHGNIVYVGKAKNLKSRLTSYFTGSHDHKTTKMLTVVEDFDYIVTKTELEALILEIDLIKKHQPRYNILLTDDKTYPYIEITDERHPKLVVTRTPNPTKKNLFGPYPNVHAARETLDVLNKLYPLRKCQTLPNEPCLYYHLGQCLAPCIHKVDKRDYDPIIKDITAFLKGKTKPIVDSLKEKMRAAADALEFERAKEYKDTIDAIHTTTSKQAVNLDDLTDRDVIALAHDEEHVALDMFFIRSGKIAARDKRLMPYYLDVDQAVLDYIIQFYRAYPIPSEILTNAPDTLKPLQSLHDTAVRRPQRGPKRRLLDLAIDNANEQLTAEVGRMQAQTEKTFGALDELAETLDIPTPYHIEAFDNSHLFGSHPVSGMVVFKNGKPAKQEYRKYKLNQSDAQSGDTEQMEEVLYRRYRRVLLEDLKRPDLIVVDGGIHQMNTAKRVLAALDLSIPVVGLAKDKRHTTSHLIDWRDNAIELDRHSKLFRLLAFIQEEAHRFAVAFHQNLRSKGVYATILDTIEGVGTKTKKKLLDRFKTVEAMKKADEQAFLDLGIPKKTVQNIKRALDEKGDY